MTTNLFVKSFIAVVYLPKARGIKGPARGIQGRTAALSRPGRPLRHHGGMKTRTTSATSNAPRHGPFRAGIAAITALLWVGLLGGCAALSPHEGDGTGAWAESPAWWYAKFRFHWPEDQDTPDWLLDGMVAREVVAPILAAHGDDIRLWRFHRRAARDASSKCVRNASTHSRRLSRSGVKRRPAPLASTISP
ncbi:MAG: hypothetical protein ACPGUC_02370, partial [Gammaproteobacteria bacterium]